MKQKDIATILVSIILGLGELYLGYSVLNIQSTLLNLQIEARRADISILVDPRRDQLWAFQMNGVYLTVNGTFSNEGARDAIIMQLELSAIYRWPDNDTYSLTQTYFNPSQYCHWSNSTILKNEHRSFSLTTFIFSSWLINTWKNQTLSIGNSRSDEFRILVKYDDGIGEKTSERIFSTQV